MRSRLWLWLYEYLERLEAGIYKVAPVDLELTSPQHWSDPANCRHISLIPHPNPLFTSLADDRATAVILDHDAPSSSSSSSAAKGRPMRRRRYRPIADSLFPTQSTEVTQGIEVTASSIFIAHQSDEQ